MTSEERQEIIDAAVEKALMLIPEVVGNLMAHHAALYKINKDFYSKYPEFKDHKQTVASVVEMIEGKDPSKEYKDILKEAVEEIRKQISTIKSLDYEETSTPSRTLNGVL